MDMTEQETKDALRKRGWSYLHRERGEHAYVYAARRVRGKREEIYIGSVQSLTAMNESELVAKLPK